MSFAWDPYKAVINLTKQGVDFADAVGIFEDEQALWRSNERHGEERYVAMGRDFKGRIVVVAFAFRGAAVRIISARRATNSEVTQYCEH